jgi:hypothetical protein
MREIVVAVAVLFAALAQVTVAPLFPIQGALFDFVLVTLITVAVWAGPRAAMVSLPFAAIFLGFVSDRAPGLLILAYLPLLPLAFVVAEANLPLSRFVQTVLVGAGVGIWARLVLSLGAFVGGAEFTLSGLLFLVLVPGVFLDILLVTFVYLPFRLSGMHARPMTLHRSTF